jgi:hypothetical protein
MSTTTMMVIPTRVCPECQKPGTVAIPAEGYERWTRGELIQVALPDTPAGIREQLKTGYHPECWDLMVSLFDED